MKKNIKPYAEQLGIAGTLKQLFVEGRMVGEWIKFFLHGKPKPSSAILLVGSGRSGTTWLANILTASPGTQQIFEPLHPKWIKEVSRLTGWDATDPYIRSFYLQADGDYPEWKEYLNRMLTGRVRCYWTDYQHNSYFPDRFLIKLIRANLMQGFIYDNFRPWIVYVTRHPCATVYSRLALQWHADIADILNQEALVEDYLHPWVGAIEKERDLLGAHAVWWAVENLVASQELTTRSHYAVTYEALCLEPQQQTRQIFSWLGVEIPPKLQAVVKHPSHHSRPGVFYESTMDRLSSWKKQLSEEEQRRILDWAHRLGVTYYNDQILPVVMQIQYLKAKVDSNLAYYFIK